MLTTDSAALRIQKTWAWVIAAVFVPLHVLVWAGRAGGDDFAAVIVGARVIHDGHPELLYNMDLTNFSRIDASDEWVDAARAIGADSAFIHPYVYNPVIAKLTAPLTGSHDFQWFLNFNLVLLTFGIVAMVWGSIELVRQATGVALWRPDVVTALLGALALSEPIRFGVWLGQNSAIVAGCAIAGLALARSRPAVAGVLIAIASAIKLTPLALVAVLVVFRHTRRAGMWTVVWSAVSAVFTYAIAGHDLVSLWIGRLRFMSEGMILEPVNQSLAAVLGRIATDDGTGAFSLPIYEVPAWVGALNLAIGWLVICAALACACYAPRPAQYPVLAIAALIWPLLFASLSWSHYMAMVLPAVLLYTAVAWRLPQTQRTTAMILPIIIAVLLMTRVSRAVSDRELPSGSMVMVPEASFLAVVLAFVALFLVPVVMRRTRVLATRPQLRQHQSETVAAQAAVRSQWSPVGAHRQG